MILNLRWFICRQLVARNKLRNMGLHNLGNFEMSLFHVFVWWHRHAYSYIQYIINASFSPGPFFAVGFPGESSGSLGETSQSYSNPIPTYMKIIKMYRCMSFLLQVVIPIGMENLKVYFITWADMLFGHTLLNQRFPGPILLSFPQWIPLKIKTCFEGRTWNVPQRVSSRFSESWIPKSIIPTNALQNSHYNLGSKHLCNRCYNWLISSCYSVVSMSAKYFLALACLAAQIVELFGPICPDLKLYSHFLPIKISALTRLTRSSICIFHDLHFQDLPEWWFLCKLCWKHNCFALGCFSSICCDPFPLLCFCVCVFFFQSKYSSSHKCGSPSQYYFPLIYIG